MVSIVGYFDSVSPPPSFSAASSTGDFTIMGSGTQTISSGTTFTFTVNLLDDALAEGTESFTFDIISPTANVGVLFTPLMVTIEDDDCKHNPLNMDALISDILYSQGTSFRPNAFFHPKSNKDTFPT